MNDLIMTATVNNVTANMIDYQQYIIFTTILYE